MNKLTISRMLQSCLEIHMLKNTFEFRTHRLKDILSFNSSFPDSLLFELEKDGNSAAILHMSDVIITDNSIMYTVYHGESPVVKTSKLSDDTEFILMSYFKMNNMLEKCIRELSPKCSIYNLMSEVKKIICTHIVSKDYKGTLPYNFPKLIIGNNTVYIVDKDIDCGVFSAIDTRTAKCTVLAKMDIVNNRLKYFNPLYIKNHCYTEIQFETDKSSFRDFVCSCEKICAYNSNAIFIYKKEILKFVYANDDYIYFISLKDNSIHSFMSIRDGYKQIEYLL